MDEVFTYLSLAVCLVVSVGIVSTLATEDFAERAGGAARLICLFVLIAPIVSAIGALSEISLPDFDSPSCELTGGYTEVSREAFCEGIAAAVAERLGVDVGCVSVKADGFIFEQMRAEGMTLTLSGGAVLSDSRGLSLWVEENFIKDGGKCKVVIDLG